MNTHLVFDHSGESERGVESKKQWRLFDCRSGGLIEVSSFPFVIEPDTDTNRRVEINDQEKIRGCFMFEKDGGIWIQTAGQVQSVVLDGSTVSEPVLLDPNMDHTLKTRSRCLVLRSKANKEGSLDQLNVDRWCIYDPASKQTYGPVPMTQLESIVEAHHLGRSGVFAYLEGTQMGFYLKDLLPVNSEPPAVSLSADVLTACIDVDGGKFCCPTCYSRFDRDDVLWVAKHPSLLDRCKWEKRQLRFRPTGFNEHGQALDSAGETCTEIACPHCKEGLAPGFLQLKNFYVSLLGDIASGKDYYLLSLIKQLEQMLPQCFGLAWRDCDTKKNEKLSKCIAAIFGGSRNPQELAITVTAPCGSNYATIELDGRIQAPARPFTYSITPLRASNTVTTPQGSLVHLYDLAGPDCRPSFQSPGMSSLKESSVILFLFDPTQDIGFRKILREHPDSQFKLQYFGIGHDIILAEIACRARSAANLPAYEKISIPLAVMVGKCDTWLHLVKADGEFPRNPIQQNRLNLDVVQKNSDYVRDLMMQISPGTVAVAESVAHDVMYFPVSALGHSPVISHTRDGDVLCPIPGEVKPILPAVPFLWAFSKANPDLIAT